MNLLIHNFTVSTIYFVFFSYITKYYLLFYVTNQMATFSSLVYNFIAFYITRLSSLTYDLCSHKTNQVVKEKLMKTSRFNYHFLMQLRSRHKNVFNLPYSFAVYMQGVKCHFRCGIVDLKFCKRLFMGRVDNVEIFVCDTREFVATIIHSVYMQISLPVLVNSVPILVSYHALFGNVWCN